MTIFSEEPHSRQMERLMTAVPNFKPRGVGFRFAETQITVITAAMPEILTAAMRQIRCPPFVKRFNEYIESEESIMTFSNEKHMAMFALAVKNAERENYALLSAIYLLTADIRLWNCCKHHINNGCIFFENIKLRNCSERAYTLYCAAKEGFDARHKASYRVGSVGRRPRSAYAVPHHLQRYGNPPLRTRRHKGDLP